MATTSVQHTESSLTGVGGLSIYWQAWVPPTPKATVVLAHGAFEHSGRYGHVAQKLTEAGIALYAVDHRGHGRSEGSRGNVDRIAHVVADLDQLVDLAREAHPDTKLFLLGHSMGGAIALEYALRHQQKIDGLILSGPAVDVSAVSGPELAISRLISAIVPNLGILRIDSSQISRDPEVVRAYDEDPLVHRGRGPARSISEILTTARTFPGRVSALNLPLFVFHGMADKLTAPNGSQIVHDGASSADKTLILYEGLFHETMNEPEQDEVIGAVVDWVAARA